jgi:hypothetical protein
VAGVGAGVRRLLLLALLGIGVIGMHTVGHSTDHHSWEALATGTSNGIGDVSDVAMAAAADTCDGDCGSHGSLAIWPDSGSHRVPGGTGLMIVCLAVLFGVGVLALLSRALARWAGPVPRGAPPGSTPFPQTGLASGRPFPLRLVDVAVLRI